MSGKEVGPAISPVYSPAYGPQTEAVQAWFGNMVSHTPPLPERYRPEALLSDSFESSGEHQEHRGFFGTIIDKINGFFKGIGHFFKNLWPGHRDEHEAGLDLQG